MRMFGAASELADAIGETFGPGSWLTVDQEMISAFADLTGDRQWVHTDPDRAAREMPGGKTIAHGYLLLSLLGRLIPELYSVQARTVLNYGVDKLRFLAPVPSGARIRARVSPKACDAVSNGARVTCELAIEIEGLEKPALIASYIFLYLD